MCPMFVAPVSPATPFRFDFHRLRRTWCAWLAAMVLGITAAHAAAPVGNTADLDRDDGLPDARLGAPLSSFQGLKKTEDTGRWLTFTRPTDRLSYAGFPLQSITYNFFKEKLYSIFIEVVDKRNVKGLLKALEQQYGKQHSYELHNYSKSSLQVEIREWAGAKAYCVYKNGSDMRGGVLTFLDKPAWDELQIPKRQQEAESRDMLKGSYLNGDF